MVKPLPSTDAGTNPSTPTTSPVVLILSVGIFSSRYGALGLLVAAQNHVYWWPPGSGFESHTLHAGPAKPAGQPLVDVESQPAQGHSATDTPSYVSHNAPSWPCR